MKLNDKYFTETDLHTLAKDLADFHYLEYLPETPANVRREIRCLFAKIIKNVEDIKKEVKK